MRRRHGGEFGGRLAVGPVLLGVVVTVGSIGFLEVVGWFGTLGMMVVLSLDFLEPAMFLGVGLGEDREETEDRLVASGSGGS